MTREPTFVYYHDHVSFVEVIFAPKNQENEMEFV